MFATQRRDGRGSHRLLVTLALVAASAAAGFAIGRHPDFGSGARAASLPPTTSSAATAPPTHDGSLPDTADTLGREKLRDEDGSPTF